MLLKIPRSVPTADTEGSDGGSSIEILKYEVAIWTNPTVVLLMKLSTLLALLEEDQFSSSAVGVQLHDEIHVIQSCNPKDNSTLVNKGPTQDCVPEQSSGKMYHNRVLDPGIGVLALR